MKRTIIFTVLTTLGIACSSEPMIFQPKPCKASAKWNPEHSQFVALLCDYEQLKAQDTSSTHFQINSTFDKVDEKMDQLLKQTAKIKLNESDIKAYRGNHETLYDSVNIAKFNNRFDSKHEKEVEHMLTALNPYK
ncbi:MAG: hypothetical protein P4L31_08145 [Candidatus Babeliales bacterium]|nr:hypothetical protein [Candidatus Babeliales bacterium]